MQEPVIANKLIESETFDSDKTLLTWFSGSVGAQPGTLSFNHVAIRKAPGREGNALRVRYQPTDEGSPRISGKNILPIEPMLGALVEFDVYFGTDWQWKRGGKFGMGLLGGTGTTGCADVDKKGWS